MVRQALQARAPLFDSSTGPTTLEDDLQRIAPAFPIPIVLDEQLAQEPAHALDVESGSVVFGAEYGTLENALSHRVRMAVASDANNGICFLPENGKIVLQTALKKEWQRTTRFYALPISGADEHAWTAEEIAFLILQSVPLSDEKLKVTDWIQLAPGGLFIAATEEAHQQVDWLVQRLRPLPNSPVSLEPQPLLALEAGMLDHAIETVLDEPLRMEKLSGTVEQALAEIACRKKIPIRVERSARWKLEDNFDWPDQNPKTLRELLTEAWISYRVDPQGLSVIPLTEFERQSTFRCYPVHDLVGLSARNTREELAAAINHHLNPFERASQPRILLADHWILVRVRDPEHAEIVTFLGRLRTALARGSASAGNTLLAAERIEGRLAESCRFGISPITFRQFCQILNRELGCEVECSGVDADLDFKLWNDGDTLGRILDDSLFMHDLTYRLISDKFCIISELERRSGLVIYDVRTLTEPGLGLMTSGSLARLLKSEVNYGSWRMRGSGEIEELGGLLLVENDTPTQWRIRAFLNYLREHRPELPRLSDVGNDSRGREEAERLRLRMEISTNWYEQRYLRFLLSEKGAAHDEPILAE